MDKKMRVRNSPPHNTPTKEEEKNTYCEIPRKIQLEIEKIRRRDIE